MPLLRYLVDTNILLRLTNPLRDSNAWCKNALRSLRSQNCSLHYTLQNAAEFWNVATRPHDRNGHGLSPQEAAWDLSRIEEIMSLLPDNVEVYRQWRRLVADHSVSGIKVHDAKLAATMLAHRVPYILTLNMPDFKRFAGITAIHPSEIKA